MQNILTDEVHLILGDCIEKMRDIPSGSIDMLFTDLPYGTTNCKWDTSIPLSDFWEEANRVVKPDGAIVMFAQSPFDKILGASNIDNLRYEWIWEKTEATGHLNARKMPMKAHENILVFYRRLPVYNPQMTHGHARKVSSAESKRNSRKSDCYGDYGLTSYDSTDRYPRSVLKGPTDKQKGSLRVAQKPVWLCRHMVLTYTNPGDTVLDCCMGTGSIGVAAVAEGRRYIGIDTDPSAFQIATERISEIINRARKVDTPHG